MNKTNLLNRRALNHFRYYLEEPDAVKKLYKALYARQ